MALNERENTNELPEVRPRDIIKLQEEAAKEFYDAALVLLEKWGIDVHFATAVHIRAGRMVEVELKKVYAQ